MMKQGFKTFTFGLILSVVPQIVNYASNFDFVHTFGLSPNSATIVGVIIVGLRAMTTTPIFMGK